MAKYSRKVSQKCFPHDNRAQASLPGRGDLPRPWPGRRDGRNKRGLVARAYGHGPPSALVLCGLCERPAEHRADESKGRRALVGAPTRETLAWVWRRRRLPSVSRGYRDSALIGVTGLVLGPSVVRAGE